MINIERSYFERERESGKISRSEIDFFLHLKEKLRREEAGKILSLIATKWGPDDLEYRVNTVSSIACLPCTALMAVFAILRYLTNLPFNLPLSPPRRLGRGSRGDVEILNAVKIC